MPKRARMLLVALSAIFLLSGCGSMTTPSCEPLVVVKTRQIPASLLIRPAEPVTLASEAPGSPSGASLTSTPKTPDAGTPADPSLIP